MNEVARTGFSIRGMNEKSQGDVFLWTSFALNSHFDRFAYRLSLHRPAGAARVQRGY